VVGTALGYRLYRRPEEGRFSSTSKANAAALNEDSIAPSRPDMTQPKQQPASPETLPSPSNDDFGVNQTKLDQDIWPTLNDANK
jgi:hypothetical protein